MPKFEIPALELQPSHRLDRTNLEYLTPELRRRIMQILLEQEKAQRTRKEKFAPSHQASGHNVGEME